MSAAKHGDAIIDTTHDACIRRLLVMPKQIKGRKFKTRKAAMSNDQYSAELSLSDVYPKVRTALENPKYKYRTVSGIAKELKIGQDVVARALRENPGDLVVLYRRGQNGEQLFTTRQHYKNNTSIIERVMGTMMSRIY